MVSHILDYLKLKNDKSNYSKNNTTIYISKLKNILKTGLKLNIKISDHPMTYTDMHVNKRRGNNEKRLCMLLS